MALSDTQKKWCLDEAIKITTAYASASRASGLLPHEALDECYKKLCQLREETLKTS